MVTVSERPKPSLLVSACLLGVCCTHDGGSETNEAVLELGELFRLVPVCPETAGGLPTPRPRAERVGSAVMTDAGDDVTGAYQRGAEHAVAVAIASKVTGAVLKSRSPSCGVHEISDGSFTKTRIPGSGVTADALLAAGIEVVDERDVADGRLP